MVNDEEGNVPVLVVDNECDEVVVVDDDGMEVRPHTGTAPGATAGPS